MGDFTALAEILGQIAISASESHSGSYDCDPCRDTGWIVEDGKGARRCDCLESVRRQRLLDRVPPEYRELDLATVTPDLSRHPKQAALLDAMRSDPTGSYALTGRVGCGKSLFGWLLYKQAVRDGRPVVALPLAELLMEYRRYELGTENVPTVTYDDLRTDKKRYFLFLDEFDKARPSEFAGEQLFLLIDTVYTYRHQLVVTSNATTDDLRAHWSRASEHYGVSIMRRLLEMDGMTRVEMF